MCPKCGGSKSRVRTRGHDAEGRYLRYRQCKDCDSYYSSVEAVIPPPGSLYVLDGFRKYRNRMEMRRRRGYHGPGLGGPPIKPEPRLLVSVRVVEPEVLGTKVVA
jgi:hypothetical protein